MVWDGTVLGCGEIRCESGQEREMETTLCKRGRNFRLNLVRTYVCMLTTEQGQQQLCTQRGEQGAETVVPGSAGWVGTDRAAPSGGSFSVAGAEGPIVSGGRLKPSIRGGHSTGPVGPRGDRLALLSRASESAIRSGGLIDRGEVIQEARETQWYSRDHGEM